MIFLCAWRRIKSLVRAERGEVGWGRREREREREGERETFFDTQQVIEELAVVGGGRECDGE